MKVFAVYSRESWYFRAMGSAYEVKASASLSLADARRVVVAELDSAFGRKGWTFIEWAD